VSNPYEKPIALDAYEQMAEGYAAKIDTKAHNAYYDRPATLSLLPSVEDKRVLDAGCGPGVYSEWLANHGAMVVAIDVSQNMVKLAERRLNGRAQILQADFGQPLSFLESESLDVIVSGLALDYLKDWTPTFAEFFRLLKADGVFVFSVSHPADEFFEHHPNGNYFDTEQVQMIWSFTGAKVSVPYYRRPLTAMIDPLLEAGFILDKLIEPKPTPEFKEQDPLDYEKLMRSPGFICFRARKGSPQCGRAILQMLT